MGRVSYQMGKDIVMGFWLAFDAQGELKMTRKQPALGRGERAMSMTLKVPVSLFEAPQLSATVAINDPGTPAPVIDITAAAAALREVVGCDVDVTVNYPLQPERNPE